jgi:hypothetical protein
MLVSDRNLITEAYADAGRAILLEVLDWALSVPVAVNNMHVVSG